MSVAAEVPDDWGIAADVARNVARYIVVGTARDSEGVFGHPIRLGGTSAIGVASGG